MKTQAFKLILRIRYKFSLGYLEIGGAVEGMTVTERFASKGPAG